MRFLYIKKLLPEWGLFFISAVLVLMAGRGFLIWKHTDSLLRTQYQQDMPALFIKGLLFDIKAVSIILAFWVLLALLALLKQTWLQKIYQLEYKGLAWSLCLLLVLTVCNVFYYATYHRQFDVFIFGLWEEDTQAVLKTIVSDYPVVWGSGILILSSVWIHQLYRYWRQWVQQWKWTHDSGTIMSQVAWLVALVAMLVLGIRGSLGTFPLRQSAAQISPSSTLNSLVVNAPIALHWAWNEYRDGLHFHEVSDAEGVDLYSAMLNQKVHDAQFKQLMVKLPENAVISEGKPNVVLAIMESMGTHLLQMDAPQRDLLGRLRPHFEQDYLFKRFVSEGDGTSETLHRLLIRSPYNNISQTAVRQNHFVSNMFQPYLDAGYRIVYITAGNGGWRNFDQFMKHLGVAEFIDETFLRHRYPEAKSSAWGVPDEYMFRYAAERLQQAKQENQAVFIMMLSVTHHPPYRLPDTEQRKQFNFSETEWQRFSSMGSRQQINEIFNTFYYANDQLGAFITQAKQVGNTLIAATGDHNIRGIAYPKTEESVLGHAVPFYIYVPEKYRINTVYDAQRIGSHKDVMPTLYALSLSGQTHLKTGCHLLSPDIEQQTWCGYGYNQDVALFNDGAMTLHDQRFYPWQDEQQLLLASHEAQPTYPVQVKQSTHYAAFLDWLTNRMITQQ